MVKEIKQVLLEDAKALVESTLDGMVFLYKDGTINEKVFYRLNDEFDEFLKKLGFLKSIRKSIEFAQWKRVTHEFNILLKIKLTDDKLMYAKCINKEVH